MTWRTHIIGGLQTGIVAASIASGSVEDSLILISAASFGSILPDIDQPGSRIGQSDALIGLVSHLVSKFTRHRGFTHTLLGAIVMAALFFMPSLAGNARESIIAFFAALFVFALVHAKGGALSYFAGWLSVAAYIFTPIAASLVSDQNIELFLDIRSARLCAIGVFFGCVSHMVYDSFNRGGVPWLWPISRKQFHIMGIKTNTFGELYFVAIQILILTVLIPVCFKDAAAWNAVKNLKLP